jgi:hypothetical protein
MQEYQEQPCIICGKPFEADDDIVTCPECGTPYHRECWKQTGRCVNDALHSSGESWISQRKKQIESERAAAHIAQEEEDSRDSDNVPPIYDGVRLNPNDPCLGMDPAEKLDGATMRETAEFVDSNRFYYLPLFRLMKRTGKKISLNLLGLLCPQFYFVNRKMWGFALLSMLLHLVLEIPSLIMMTTTKFDISIPWADVNAKSFQTVSGLCYFAYIAISVFWGLFANYFYYRFTQRRITGIRKESGAEGERLYPKLREAGGTSLLNVVLMFLIQGAFAVCLCYWLI